MIEYEYICLSCGKRYPLIQPITDVTPDSLPCTCGEHAVRIYDAPLVQLAQGKPSEVKE